MARLLQVSSLCFDAVALAILHSIRSWQWTIGACIGMAHISCMYHSPCPPGRCMYLIDKVYNHSIVVISFFRIMWIVYIGIGDCASFAWHYMISLAYISVLYFGFGPLQDLPHATIHIVSSYGIYHYAVLEHNHQHGLCRTTGTIHSFM